MSDWWYIIVIVALAAVGLLVLRSRLTGAGGRTGEPRDLAQPPRDFGQERETDRVGHLSEEDRSWEAASLKRNQEARARNQAPPDSG